MIALNGETLYVILNAHCIYYSTDRESTTPPNREMVSRTSPEVMETSVEHLQEPVNSKIARTPHSVLSMKIGPYLAMQKI